MKKKIRSLLAAALVLCTVLLSGCTRAKPLPDGLTEDQVAEVANAVVEELLAGEYQTVADRFRDDMQQELTIDAQKIEALMATVEEAGAYVGTAETLVLGGKSKNFDEPYAAVAVYCEHKEKAVVYEMSLDMNLELIGLAAKQK